jgi:tRNA dimethylallyltransferase
VSAPDPTSGGSPVGVLVGPTASGKTALAVELARRLGDVEIISMDSMVVYRGMDVGTATPTPAERAAVPHHLVDVVDPAEDHTVAAHQALVAAALADIDGRGRRALLVGGTGLYVRAVVDRLRIPPRYPEVRAELEAQPDTVSLHRRLAELDAAAAARMEPTNRRRVVRALEVTIGSGVPFSEHGPGLEHYPDLAWPIVGLDVPRDVLDIRIAARYRRQLAAGFVDEVRVLSARPGGLSATARQALGYRELLEHVEDGAPLDACVEVAVRRTRRFARRQQRWFRRDPRIRWVAAPDPDDPALLDAVRLALGW